MEEICKDLDLDINYDMMTCGGTDADNIHKAHDGVVHNDIIYSYTLYAFSSIDHSS
ncbi:MAG: hypothetical protein ACLTTH_10500 [Holdemanella porci]